MNRRLLFTTLLAAFGGTFAMADMVSVDFETYNAGSLQGANGAYTGGDGNAHRSSHADKWWAPGNGVAEGTVVSGVAKSGNQSLLVSRLGNGNDGVIHGLKTPLTDLVGETGAPVNATYDEMNFSFWFRTASATPVNNLSFTTNMWGNDRYSWMAFQSDGSGNLTFRDLHYQNETTVQTDIATGLAWGEWYQVVGNAKFNDGLNANTSPNDAVTLTLKDSSGTVLGSHVGSTWEEAFREDYFGDTNPFAVDGLGFNVRNSSTPGAIAYIDDVQIQAVPEPATMAALGLGAAALLRRRRKNA